MRVEVLGPIRVDGDDGALGPRDRVVLGVLVSHRGRQVHPETLADALWPDLPPPTWPKVVQGCVARLRKVLGRDAIATVARSYRLTLPASEIDAARFEATAARVDELLELGEPDRAAYLADEALGWWRGRPLPELDGWEAGRDEADRLEELRRDLAEARLDALLRAGRHREVLVEAKAQVAEAPLRERRWALLAMAQYQAGRQGEALATLRRARSALADGLGLDPGPELAALEARILRQEPALPAGDALPDPSPVCPYLGLVPYGEEDADRFFGRARDVEACLQRLADAGVLAVVGPSGSGKSSLVRAGVVARLRRDGRRVEVITPGAQPMDALSGVGPARDVVLVVDQCEEAVTLCTDQDEQQRFFAAIVVHADHAPLVVALRADRLGDLAAYPAFAALVQRGLHLLTRMTEDDLRAAIEGPAHQAGLLVEAGLTDLMIRDVEQEPGALPLLSHTLRQTWLRREGRTLTVAGYRASGGIRGAVAQTAEQVYEQAGPEQRRILRDLLLRLVVPSPEGEPARSRIPRRMVAVDDAHTELLERLVAARLLTSDEASVQIAHEALTRAWPRLRSWLDDDVDGLRILRHLAVAADGWDAMGRPDSELYRGARLTRAVAWRDRTGPDLTPAERDFLAASAARADADARQVRRRRRTLVGVLAGATVLSTFLASVAVVQARQSRVQRDNAITAEAAAEAERERAEDETRRAEDAAALARTRELAASAVSVRETDPELSALLALAALEGAPEGHLPIETVTALHDAVQRVRTIRLLAPEEGGAAGSDVDAAISPDGSLLVTIDGADRLRVDEVEGELLWELVGGVPGGRFQQVYLDPDGVTLAVEYHVDEDAGAGEGASAPDATAAGLAPGVHLLELATGRPVATFPASDRCSGPSLPNGRVFTPDGGGLALLAGGTLDEDPEACEHRLEVVHPASGEVLHAVPVQPFPVEYGVANWVSMDVAGRAAILEPIGNGFVTRVVDLATTATLLEVDEQLGTLSPDGSVLAVSNDSAASRGIRLDDLDSGEELRLLRGHRGGVNEVAFSSDGTRIYTAGADGTARVWDVASGFNELTLTGAASGLVGVAADATGERLVGVGMDGTVRVWDLTHGVLGELSAVDLSPAQVASRGLAARGGGAAALVFEGECPEQRFRTALVEPTTGELRLELADGVGNAMALSSDGRMLLHQRAVTYGPGVTCADQVVGPVAVRDMATGEVLGDLEGWCDWQELEDCDDPPTLPYADFLFSVSITGDDRYVAAGGYRGTAAVWDLGTRQLVTLLGPFDGLITGVATHPDGDHTVVYATGAGGSDAALHVHDHEGEELAQLPFPVNANGTGQIAFTDDGAWLAAGGERLALFDASDRSVRWEVDAHDGGVYDLDLSPDGTRVVTTGSDGVVREWAVDDGRLLQVVPLGDAWGKAVRYVDDHRVVVGLSTGVVAVHTTDVAELAAIARSRISRELTEQECRTYLQLETCSA